MRAVARVPASSRPSLALARARSAVAPVVSDVLRSPGLPLEDSTRVSMERRFSHDFSRVRVHHEPLAARSAHALNAVAYTVGSDVVFGHGQYAPRTSTGRRLIAHELTHVVQQSGTSRRDPLEIAPPDGAPEREADAAAQSVSAHPEWKAQVTVRGARGIQRQPVQPSAPAIGAREILPFRERHQIQIDQTMKESLAALLAALDPDMAAILKAVSGQRATVTRSTDDVVEADFNQREITLPSTGTFRDVKLSLSRSSSGTFDFEISGLTGQPPVRTSIFSRTALTAERSGNGFVLSSGTGKSAVRELGTHPQPKGVDLRVFAESISQSIARLGEMDAISLSELPPARAGPEEVERAGREAVKRAAERRVEPRQQVELGVGLTTLSDPRLLLRGSWQYTFQPLPATGNLLGVPLQVAIQYAPDSGVLGRVAGGAATSLSALKIPVNLRVLTGGAGGQAPGGQPVAGITVGAGVGTELARWRVQLDYDHMFNLVNRSGFRGASSLVLSGGVAF